MDGLGCELIGSGVHLRQYGQSRRGQSMATRLDFIDDLRKFRHRHHGFLGRQSFGGDAESSIASLQMRLSICQDTAERPFDDTR